MKNLMILCFLLPLQSFAQDLTGVWTGTLYNDSTRNTTSYQIAVSEKNGKYAAYSYALFKLETKEVYGIKTLEIVRSRDKIFFRDKELIEDNYPADAPTGVKQITAIRIFDSASRTYMSGTFITTRSGKYGRPVTGSILLVKENENLQDITLIKRIIKQNLAPTLAFLTDDILKKKRPDTETSAAEKKEAKATQVIKANDNTAVISAAVDQKKNEPIRSDSSNAFTANNVSVQPEKNAEIKQTESSNDSFAADRKNVQTSVPVNEKNKETAKQESVKLSAAAQQKEADKKNGTAAISESKAVKEPEVKAKKEENKSVPEADLRSLSTIQKKNTDASLQGEKNSTVKTGLKDNTDKKEDPKTSTTMITQPQKKRDSLMMIKTADNVSAAGKLPMKSISVIDQLASRKIENIQTVEFVNDSLRLELYDNGTIDGDSVSVIVNGVPVLEHQLLSGKAISKTVYATGDSLKIVMFAENLGSIAPNTGLLIVYDGTKRYEITFSGDLQKNSAILFKRRR